MGIKGRAFKGLKKPEPRIEDILKRQPKVSHACAKDVIAIAELMHVVGEEGGDELPHFRIEVEFYSDEAKAIYLNKTAELNLKRIQEKNQKG